MRILSGIAAALLLICAMPAAFAQSSVGVYCQSGTTGTGAIIWSPASAANPCPVGVTGPTGGPISVIPDASVSTGYQQVTGLTSAKSFTPPAGTTYCNVISTGAAINFRSDGTAPTASVGMPLAVNQPAAFRMSVASLAAIQFIQQAATAVLNVDCYKDQ